MKIYNMDGTTKELNEDQYEVITFKAGDITSMKNIKNGVNLYFKDGTVKFIDNAKTDGMTLEFELNSK